MASSPPARGAGLGRRTLRGGVVDAGGARGAGGALNLPWPGDLTGLPAPAVYVTLFGFVFVESGVVVGFLLPGDSILFAAGLLAAEPGSPLSLPLLAVGAFVCAATGNVVGYWTGGRFGRPWLLARAGRAARHVERAERFYEHYGWLAVVAARFIPWARTFTPVAAGVAGMSRPAFLSATLTGAAVWGAGLVVLGYLAHDVPWLARLALAIAAVAVAASVLAPLAGWASRRIRNRRDQNRRNQNRRDQDRRNQGRRDQTERSANP